MDRFDWRYRKYAKKGWIQLYKRSYNNDVNSRIALARGRKSGSNGLVEIKDMSNLVQEYGCATTRVGLPSNETGPFLVVIPIVEEQSGPPFDQTIQTAVSTD